MFLVFATTSFNARGGWHDFIGSFTSLAEAEGIVSDLPSTLDNWHIVDLDRRSVVKNGRVTD